MDLVGAKLHNLIHILPLGNFEVQVRLTESKSFWKELFANSTVISVNVQSPPVTKRIKDVVNRRRPNYEFPSFDALILQ